ncbi:MAG TPA: hypothetical protein VM582_08660 [Candidatus Thermoplasmatota archaeon]|nr:hypothetical protein [Candidatus Thermoplasmatota archaeon]
MRRALLVLAALLALAPPAAAVDLLASEARLGEHEARLLVRSPTGSVNVRTEPAVLVGGARPGGAPGELAPAPVALRASHVWHGLDGVVEVVLVRERAGETVDVVLEDGATAGLWVEWGAAVAATRPVPGPSALAAALVAAMLIPRGAHRSGHAKRAGPDHAPEARA